MSGPGVRLRVELAGAIAANVQVIQSAIDATRSSRALRKHKIAARVAAGLKAVRVGRNSDAEPKARLYQLYDLLRWKAVKLKLIKIAAIERKEPPAPKKPPIKEPRRPKKPIGDPPPKKPAKRVSPCIVTESRIERLLTSTSILN